MRSWCACPLCREIGFYCGTSSVVILQSQLKVTQFCMFNKFHINQYLCIFYVSSDMSKHDNAIPWLIYPYIQCIVKALSNVINCQSQSNLLENWVQSEHHLLTRLVFSSFWWVSKPNVWTCYMCLDLKSIDGHIFFSLTHCCYVLYLLVIQFCWSLSIYSFGATL